MGGRVTVMRPEDYRPLGRRPAAGGGPAREGAALFTALGCSGCHAPGFGGACARPAGVYGRMVHLADGRTVRADEAYLRDSILQPKRDVVAGYEPIMPSFAGVVGDDDLARLVAYIKSLGAHAAAEAGMMSAPSGPPRCARPASPEPRDYLRAGGHTVASWLLTTDHKRIAILYATAITLFSRGTLRSDQWRWVSPGSARAAPSRPASGPADSARSRYAPAGGIRFPPRQRTAG